MIEPTIEHSVKTLKKFSYKKGTIELSFTLIDEPKEIQGFMEILQMAMSDLSQSMRSDLGENKTA